MKRSTALARVERLLIATQPVGYFGRRPVVVLDEAAGRPQRYTVYSLPASPSRRVRVIGRELSLNDAVRIASRPASASPRPVPASKRSRRGRKGT